MLKLSYLHLCLKSSNKIQSYTFNVFKPLTCTYYPLFPWLTNFSFSLFPPCLYFRQYTTQRLLKYLIRKIQNNYYNPIIFKFILDLIFDKKKYYITANYQYFIYFYGDSQNRKNVFIGVAEAGI